MSLFTELNYGFNEIPIKIPQAFVVETDKQIIKIIRKHKGLRIVKTTRTNLK